MQLTYNIQWLAQRGTSKISGIEGALKRLSACVKVQGSRHRCLLYCSSNSLLTALLPTPQYVGGHNPKNRRQCEGNPCTSLEGPLSKSCPLPFLTNQAHNLQWTGTPPLPFCWSACPLEASWAQGHPQLTPSSVLRSQNKTERLTF